MFPFLLYEEIYILYLESKMAGIVCISLLKYKLFYFEFYFVDLAMVS